MRYPKLVPQKYCTTPVRVVFLGGIDIEGKETVVGTYCGKCNLVQTTKQKITADKRSVTIDAVALFDGDIAPYLPQPKGLLFVTEVHSLDCESTENLETESKQCVTFSAEGKAYRIFSYTKACDPDGTVNYTRLELVR